MTQQQQSPSARFGELEAKWAECDEWSSILRDALVEEELLDPDEYEIADAKTVVEIFQDAAEALTLMTRMRDEEYAGRDTLSAFCLSVSLCPIHFTDYAECFEEEYPECEGVRVAFPSHDT